MDHPRHDKNLILKEERRLDELLDELPDEEKNKLDLTISLIPKFND